MPVLAQQGLVVGKGNSLAIGAGTDREAVSPGRGLDTRHRLLGCGVFGLRDDRLILRGGFCRSGCLRVLQTLLGLAGVLVESDRLGRSIARGTLRRVARRLRRLGNGLIDGSGGSFLGNLDNALVDLRGRRAESPVLRQCGQWAQGHGETHGQRREFETIHRHITCNIEFTHNGKSIYR